MDLIAYLQLKACLRDDKSTKEQRRAFLLEHKLERTSPLKQLHAWLKAHCHPSEQLESFRSFWYGVNVLLSLLALAFGVLSGLALLHYSGEAPVNLIYFLVVVVGFTLLGVVMTLLALLGVNKRENLWAHLAVGYWLEKIVVRFFPHKETLFGTCALPTSLQNWLVIKQTLRMSLLFALGILLALLASVAMSDLAFAWRTTLDISPEQFHQWMLLLATPWKGWLPEALPSLELIEKSHYFRLGGLQESLVQEASLLGGWWRFLAMTTLVYGVGVRFVLYLLVHWGSRKAFERAALQLPEATMLLHDMNEPFVQTQSVEEEAKMQGGSTKREQGLEALPRRVDSFIGWGFSRTTMLLLQEMWHLEALQIEEVGGLLGYAHDMEVASRQQGKEVLFAVKAWEPPTMEVLEYIEALAQEATRVVVVLVGEEHNGYRATTTEQTLWHERVATLAKENVWIVH